MPATRGMVVAAIAAAIAAFVLALAAAAPSASAQGGQWLAGDLHAHTTYSHDSWGGPGDENTGPEEPYTLGHTVASQFAVAESRGLDYLAITDHNDVRSQADDGYPGTGGEGTFGVPGYENSLDGHAQMLGATELLESGPGAAEVQAVADRLRSDPYRGAFQVNHPAEGSTAFPEDEAEWELPHDADWTLGYQVVPDTVEVWNISRLYQPPLPSASSNDDAVRFWEGFLDRGHRVAATGGSDNHYLATTAVQGVGQPTTWVYASDRSAAGVLAGLREGRTFISHQPPNLGGPRIFLEADQDGDGDFEAMVGDTVSDSAALRVRVEGAPAAMLRIVGSGGRELGDPVTVTGPLFEHRFQTAGDTSWVRAEIFTPDGAAEREQACDEQLGGGTTYCRNMLGILAMTSAIFLRPPADAGGSTTAGEERAPAESLPGAAGAAADEHTSRPSPRGCGRGTKRGDRLAGTLAADCLRGGAGDDRLSGRGGDDRLLGGRGDDRLRGGAGADLVGCGRGEDVARVDPLDRTLGCEEVRGA